MKTYFSCSLAGIVLLAANNTHAGGGMEGFGVPSNMNFYIGASAGTAAQDGACDVLDNQNACDDSGSGYKVFAGTRLSPQTQNANLPVLGVEGGYINFGESTAKGDLINIRQFDIGDTSSSSNLSGFYAVATASKEIAPRTTLFGKGGALYWTQENETSIQETGLSEVKTSSEESGFGGLLGLGAEYQMTDNLSVRGEYERGFGVGKDDTKTDPSLLSVGAVFSTL